MRTRLIALSLLTLAAASASSQEPQQNAVTLSTGGTRFHTNASGDTTELEGQLSASVRAPGKVIVEGFGRFTRTQGATTDSQFQQLLDPKTFRSIVATLEVRRAFASYLEAECSSGVSWNRDKTFDPRDPSIWQIGCGLRAWLKDRGSFSSHIGPDGSVGGLGVFGRLVVNKGEKARMVSTYSIPFSVSKFRANPIAFTSGVQLDVFAKKF